MQTHNLSWLLLAAISSSALGCAALSDETAELTTDEATAIAEGTLLGNPKYYWPKTDGTVVIPVCWEANAFGSTALDAGRSYVRSAIQQWARYAPITFTGFGRCASNPTSAIVRIQQCTNCTPQSAGDAAGADTAGYLAYKNGQGIMNLDLLMNCSHFSTNEHCVRAIAVHEFGHVLGFWHEEERDDWQVPNPLPSGSTASRCAYQTYGQYNSQPQYYGAQDLDSVMSYCGQVDVRTWKETLSPGDVASVQKAYGRKRSGEMVTPNAECLASQTPTNGALPSVSPTCNFGGNGTGQKWLRDGQHVRRNGTTYCLDVTNGSTSDGTTLQMKSCASTSANQNFSFANVALRGWGGLCVDVPNGNAVAGVSPKMHDCVGEFTDPVICPFDYSVNAPHDVKCQFQSWSSANQRWNVRADGLIQFVGTNLCLAYGSFTDGDALRLASCNASSEKQRFYFRNDGSIRMKNSSGAEKCVDQPAPITSSYLAGSGLPQRGAIPQLFTCISDQLNQKWNTSGALSWTGQNRAVRNSGGWPSVVTSSAYTPGTAVPRQMIWDYYYAQ